MMNPCGFAIRSKDDSAIFLPLKSVSVNVTIVDISAQVELVQVYHNSKNNGKASARYMFPVPAGAAVCSFRMETTSGKKVKAVVKEVSKAKKEYTAAVAKGKWAGLVEQLTGDVFVISVGAIPANEDIKVFITFVEELTQDDLVNQVRFQLPTYIAERYGGQPDSSASPSHNKSLPPPIVNISVAIQMASPIQKIHSPSHSIKHTPPALTKTGDATVYTSVATLKTRNEPVDMSNDFILTIQAADLNKPRCVASVDRDKNSVAMSLTLVPQFGIPPIESQEYVFIIDRSGSMGGSKMNHAKDALTILLKSLPAKGMRFNIASFGSNFSFLWFKSREYNQETLKAATEHVQGMSADMGGTEIEGVLSAVFRERSKDIPTSVFLLTDGEVWNTDPVYRSIKGAIAAGGDASGGTYLRVFSLGIGSGASSEMCRGIARTGNGICYMVVNNQDIPSRCSSLLKAARVPPIGSLWGLTMDWGYPKAADTPAKEAKSRRPVNAQIDAKTFSFFDETTTVDVLETQHDREKLVPRTKGNSLVKQGPATVPDVYPLNRFIVSAILLDTTQVPSSVTLKGKLPSGGDEIKMTFQVQRAEPTHLLHTLAARRLITDLEARNYGSLNVEYPTESIANAEIVKLSEEYQIASRLAAFVAVEEDSGEDLKQEGSDEEYGVSLFKSANSLQESVISLGDDEEYDPLCGGEEYGSSPRERSRPSLFAFSARPAANPFSGAHPNTTTLGAFSSSSALPKSKKLGGFGSFFSSSLAKKVPQVPAQEPTVISPAGLSFMSASPMPPPPAPPPPMSPMSPPAFAPVRPPGCMPLSPCEFPPFGTASSVQSMSLTPVSIATLQHHAGSFQLDGPLSLLVSSARKTTVTVDDLTKTIPSQLSRVTDAQTVWATVLVAALMRKRMSSTKDTWLGMWEKAKLFVCGSLGGDEDLFMQLLDEAEKHV